LSKDLNMLVYKSLNIKCYFCIVITIFKIFDIAIVKKQLYIMRNLSLMNFANYTLKYRY